jgi:hypothetical protein
MESGLWFVPKETLAWRQPPDKAILNLAQTGTTNGHYVHLRQLNELFGGKIWGALLISNIH